MVFEYHPVAQDARHVQVKPANCSIAVPMRPSAAAKSEEMSAPLAIALPLPAAVISSTAWRVLGAAGAVHGHAEVGDNHGGGALAGQQPGHRPADPPGRRR